MHDQSTLRRKGEQLNLPLLIHAANKELFPLDYNHCQRIELFVQRAHAHIYGIETVNHRRNSVEANCDCVRWAEMYIATSACGEFWVNASPSYCAATSCSVRENCTRAFVRSCDRGGLQHERTLPGTDSSQSCRDRQRGYPSLFLRHLSRLTHDVSTYGTLVANSARGRTQQIRNGL